MRAIHKWLLVASSVVVLAGLVGIAVHTGRANGSSATTTSSTRPAPATTSTTRRPRPTPTTVSGPPGPNSAALAAGMLTPTDMGGFYYISLQAAATTIASAPCLAGLDPSPLQSGRVAQSLVGPNYQGVPNITELAVSYPRARAVLVFRAVEQALRACPTFPIDVAGSQVRVPMELLELPQIGQQEITVQGQFSLAGRTLLLQVGAVLQDQTLLVLVYYDTVPPSDAIMGTFPSTLGAAVGKLS